MSVSSSSPSMSPNPGPSPTTQQHHDENRFLEFLYREIEVALTKDELFDDDGNVLFLSPAAYADHFGPMLAVIRTARVTHAFDAMPPAQRAQFAATIEQYQLRDDASQALTDAVAAFGPEVAQHRSASEVTVRLGGLLKRVSALVLCLCAHSEAFRRILRRSSSAPAHPAHVAWAVVVEAVAKNAASIELFGRLRGFNGFQAMTHDNDVVEEVLCTVYPQLLGLGNARHEWRWANYFGAWDRAWQPLHRIPQDEVWEHVWALGQPGEAAHKRTLVFGKIVSDPATPGVLTNANGELVLRVEAPQLNIDESFVPEDVDWPLREDWPLDDPRYCGPWSPACVVCGERVAYIDPAPACECSFEDLQKAWGGRLGDPRSELTTTAMGTGVRALQRIRAGDYLAEYLGEMYPDGQVTDPEMAANPDTEYHYFPRRYKGPMGGMYRYMMEMHSRRLGELRPGSDYHYTKGEWDEDDFQTFVVDPALRGNWTRYINHSCDESTAFREVSVGGKMLVVVQAKKDIAFGEQMTVNYGDDYFRGSLDCRCGADICTLWNAKSLKDDGDFNEVTLGEARSDGTAPAWALGTEGAGEQGAEEPDEEDASSDGDEETATQPDSAPQTVVVHDGMISPPSSGGGNPPVVDGDSQPHQDEDPAVDDVTTRVARLRHRRVAGGRVKKRTAEKVKSKGNSMSKPKTKSKPKPATRRRSRH